jgi:hydroxyacylglutathione hydrolase
MTPPPWLRFFQRAYPSGNMVLVTGSRPALVDSGLGSDIAETVRLLAEAGTPAERLALVINTHYHCDHAGGNHVLQQRHGVAIAAHTWEAAVVNARDRDACAAEWLNQPVEPYHVDQALHDGDVIETGEAALRVVHTPGHTLGSICLYAPEEQVLICGDVVHADDVAWLNVFREGAGALQRALASLDRLAALPVRWACSGHGPAIEAPGAAIDAARRRYERWQQDPRKLGWHACKRLFAYALMLEDGLNADEVAPYLARCPWFADYSRWIFAMEPEDFVQPMLQELVRSGAAEWRGGRIVARAPYVAPPKGWVAACARPRDWPPVRDEVR